MGRTIIHIGLPRAASTYFQQEIFPKIPFFRLFSPDVTEYHPAFQQMLYAPAKAYTADLIEAWKAANEDASIILSNELFCGRSHRQASANRLLVAQRLQQHWPEAEILVFLRNQTDLLQSLYAIDTYSGMAVEPDDYIDFGKNQPAAAAYYEWAGSWDYQSLISLYRSLFAHVHVVLFEDFTADSREVITLLSEKLHVEIPISHLNSRAKNSSLGNAQIRAIRRFNSLKPILTGTELGERFFRKSVNLIEHYMSIGKKFEFSADLKSKIKTYYEESNRRLEEDLALVNNSRFRENYL